MALSIAHDRKGDVVVVLVVVVLVLFLFVCNRVVLRSTSEVVVFCKKCILPAQPGYENENETDYLGSPSPRWSVSFSFSFSFS